MRGAVNLRPFNKVPAMLLICLISFEGAFELCSDFSSEAIKQYARHSVPDMWVVNLFIIRSVRRVFL